MNARTQLNFPYHGIAVSALLAVQLLLPVGSALSAKAADLDTELRQFENVVFGSEYGGTEATHVQKWVSPIRVSVTSMQGKMLNKAGGGRELKLSYVRPDEAYVTLIRKHLTTLVKLTGVANEKSDKQAGKNANFFIKFVPRLVMGQPFLAEDVDPGILATLAKPGVCYFLSRSIRTGAMFRVLIVVNNELPPEQMDACLLEEMTQAFGLPNDSDIVTPSIFNQTSTLTALQASDVLLLRTLYDRRLPAGTPRADAMRLARQIMQEHLHSR